MFYHLFQPLVFIHCARLSNCLDQILFLTCTPWSSFWNLKSGIQTILLEPLSIINLSFFLYRQFLMIQGIFLCASNWWLLDFFSLNLAHFFPLHAKLWMEQILTFYFLYKALVLIYLCKIQFVSHFPSSFFHCHFFFLRSKCLCHIAADDHVTHVTTLPWLLSLK